MPIYAWQTGAVPAMLYYFGPESLGGGGDLAEKISKIELENTEARDKEIGRVCIPLCCCLLTLTVRKIYRRLDGKVVKMPGIPLMYDYEYFPQTVRIEPIKHFLIPNTQMVNYSQPSP